MPFCHLSFTCKKPKYISHLWKSALHPANLRHIGEHIKKRRFDLKIRVSDCRLILGVSKRTLIGWEKGSHKPSRRMHNRIVCFLGYNPF